MLSGLDVEGKLREVMTKEIFMLKEILCAYT